MSRLTSPHSTQIKAFRLHIHKTGSLRLQVATDMALDKNGEFIVNLEGSVAKDLYLHAKQKICHIPYIHGTPQLAFAICESKEYLVNMQESKNKS